MNRKPLMGALLVAAASLLATGAYADNNASPQGKAAAGDKGGDKGDKGDKADKGDKDKKGDNAAKSGDDKGKPGDKADDKGGKAGEDHGAKKAKEHEALKEQLKHKLKGPPDAALKEELRRHAERTAKLQRIKTVADGEKDKATSDKATALLAKEDARHDKWMEKHVDGTPAAGTPATSATPAAAPATTGGSK